MFRISVVDHIRLNFDRTSQNYTLHARAAERLAVTSARIRIGVLILLAIAALAAATSLAETGRYFQITAAVAIGLAFAAHAAYLAIGIEGRVHAHRSCAERLWVVCDRYQSLLSEIEDGLLDRAAILERRDELGAQMHAAYEQPFSLDQKAYESARHTSDSKARPVDMSADVQEPAIPASLQASSEPAMQNPPH
jgi:conflict system pore-forming effector with SLATT domain